MKNTILAYVVLALACVAACGQPSGAPASLPDVVQSVAFTPSLLPDDAPPAVAPAPPKPDPRTPAQIAIAACSRTDGSWACPAIKRPMAASGNASAAQCGPACTVGSWYIDWQNTTTCASDGNSCTSATCGGSGIGPCLTFAQIVTRLGSTIPQYPFGQSVTFFGLSPQTAGVDVIFFEPRLSGGGIAVLDMRQAWVAAGAAFSSGALSGGYGYAGATRSAGGVPLTMAAMPGYVVNNTLLNNTSKSSYALVYSAASGYIDQPMTVTSLTTTTAIPAPAAENDWTAAGGDNIQPYTLPVTNVKRWVPVGGDLSSGAQPSGGWVIGARIVDPDTSGASAYMLNSKAAINVLSICQVDSRLETSNEGGRGPAPFLLGTNVTGLVLIGPNQAGIYGGAFAGSLSCYGNPTVTNNAIFHGTVTATIAYIAAQNVWSDAAWTVEPGAGVSAGTVWGTYSATLNPNSTWWNNSGSTFVLAALLTNGTLKIGSATTGSSYSGSGVMVDGVNLTPTNIDSGGAGGAGLFNPRTGARFTNSQ